MFTTLHRRLLFFSFVSRIHFFDCTGNNPPEENVPSSSRGADSLHFDQSISTIYDPDTFIPIWNDVNLAIEKFIQNYESQHQTKINVDRQLEAITEDRNIDSSYKIYRLKFSLQHDTDQTNSSVVIKIPYLGRHYLWGEKYLLQKKEKFVYEKVLPLMFESYPSDLEKLSPILYVSTESGILVLENLHESKLHMKNDKLLSYSAAKGVLRSLAMFHALSVPHLDKVSLGLDSLTTRDRGTLGLSTGVLPKLVRKFLANVFPLISQDVREKVRDAVTNLPSVVESVFSPKTDGFNVLIYGDPNYFTLFIQKDHENNAISSCKFTEFQNSRRGSPVIDVINFLISSVQFEVIRTYYLNFFHFYVDELNKVLGEIGGDDRRVYFMHEYRADIEKYRKYFILKLIFIIPLCWNNFAAVGEDDTQEDDYDILYKSEKYLLFFQTWMQLLDS